MTSVIDYQWRGPLTDGEMLDLAGSHGGTAEPEWWTRISSHSLGWVTARDEDALLVGFVNVAWDGGGHAFLIDTRTRGTHQRRGIGTRLVEIAIKNTRAAGCEWLHVDFAPDLAPFYFEAAGFRPTVAGLVHLTEPS